MKKIVSFFLLLSFSLLLFSSCSRGEEKKERGYEENRGYQYLMEQENGEALTAAYEKFEKGIREYKKTIFLLDFSHPITTEEMDIVYDCVWADFPEFFWIPRSFDSQTFDNYLLSLSPNYEIEKEEAEGMREKMEEKVEEVMRTVEGMKEEEKEKYIHDFLVNSISFSYPEESKMANTVYGALVEGKANCMGYSFAFLYLMREIGVPGFICFGEAGGGEHAWNIVQVDGEFLHVDTTWADLEEISYQYYNVTTEEISKDHKIEEIVYGYPEL